jgi:hypothetical protein
MWKEENEDSVYHYHEFGNINLNDDAPSTEEEEAPYCLAIQTPWQLEMMVRYGHRRQLSMDATFGTNEPKVLLDAADVLLSWDDYTVSYLHVLLPVLDCALLFAATNIDFTCSIHYILSWCSMSGRTAYLYPLLLSGSQRRKTSSRGWGSLLSVVELCNPNGNLAR